MTEGQEVAVTNGSFSLQLPTLQLVVDSTSLGEFKKCPRSYYYAIVLGWQSQRRSVHLDFGIWFHGATERYAHAKAAQQSHDQALRRAVKWVMEQTWDARLRRPWQSDDPKKNRWTLIRSIVWYLEEYKEDSLEVAQLMNGKPAVELSVAMGINKWAFTGEQFALAGHLDAVVNFNGELYISDKKTTGSELSPKFFQQFTPNGQMSGYAVLAHVGLNIPVRGVIIDGVQVGAGFTRFQRGLAQRTVGQLEEWLKGFDRWLDSMQECAQQAIGVESVESGWPQNDKSCDHFGGCQFREVCGRSPGKGRQEYLQAHFVKRVWDPTVMRGDV